jgi:hypothetical protein
LRGFYTAINKYSFCFRHATDFSDNSQTKQFLQTAVSSSIFCKVNYFPLSLVKFLLMSKLTLQEFFELYPIKEPRLLTKADLIILFEIINNSLVYYIKDDKTLTEREKIDSYISLCRKEIDKQFTDVNLEGKIELSKYFNLYGNFAIVTHLKD